jgi:hypothetical protein
MTDSKRLYFIPIIAKAMSSNDPEPAMTAAFEEIIKLGELPEYKEGLLQFQAFVRQSLDFPKEATDWKSRVIRDAIYRILYDFATDTFSGDESSKKTITEAIKGHSKWRLEFEKIKEEVQCFRHPDAPITVEVLKDNHVINSFSVTAEPFSIHSINPGQYTVRLCNGRVLWEGYISKEDIIWSYACPQKDLPMAAKTDEHRQMPAKTVSLLNSELIMQVYAGLESGRIIFKSG